MLKVNKKLTSIIAINLVYQRIDWSYFVINIYYNRYNSAIGKLLLNSYPKYIHVEIKILIWGLIWLLKFCDPDQEFELE